MFFPYRPQVAALVVLCLLTMVVGCTQTPEVGSTGGTLTWDDNPSVQLEVPRGATSTEVEVEFAGPEGRPDNTFGADATPVGAAVDIKPSKHLSGARVRLPVDTKTLDATSDVFIAVYNAKIDAWVPLLTELDMKRGQAIAIAPHYSWFTTFRTKVTAQAGRFVHDATAGFKLIENAVTKTLRDWFNGEVKRAECGAESPAWTFSSNLGNSVKGCVTVDSRATVHVSNDLRLPYVINVPPGTKIGLTDYDYDLSPVTALIRTLNRLNGQATVGTRWRTKFELPENLQAPGSEASIKMFPDQLGLALEVVIAMLGWIPPAQVFARSVSRTVIVRIWETAPNSTRVIDHISHFRRVFLEEVREPRATEIASIFFDAAECVAAGRDSGMEAFSGSAEEFASATVKLAKDCLSGFLEARKSDLSDLWNAIKRIPDGFRVFGQIYDAARVGLTHWGGEVQVEVKRKIVNQLEGVDWASVVTPELCDHAGQPGYPVLAEVEIVRDVTSDGFPETLVTSSCPTTTASNPVVVYIYDGSSSADSPRLIGKLGEDRYFKGVEVDIADSEIHVRGPALSNTAPRCCPDLMLDQRYKWDGSAFARISEQASAYTGG
jgi:hypothetical protein